MTSVTLTEITDPAHLPRFWQTLNIAFGPTAPLVNILFPKRGTSTGDAFIVHRLQTRLTARKKGSKTHYVEAWIDGKSAGAAIWTEMFQPPSAELSEYEDVDINQTWEDEDDRDYAKAIWKAYMVHRGGFVREHAKADKPVWVLEWLAVSPSARRRGVGEALTSWGRDQADAMGAESVLESNVAGMPLYLRCGYEAVAKIDFGLDGDGIHGGDHRFRDRAVPDLTFMRRVKARDGEV